MCERLAPWFPDEQQREASNPDMGYKGYKSFDRLFNENDKRRKKRREESGCFR
jgi:hypothetical protein